MFTTYIIKNCSGKSYTGSTENVKERILMHNDISVEKARFHRTTYNKGPWSIFFSKDFETRKESLDFEKFLKTGAGREWLERARRGG
ncbi:MAG: GIY-YIG nuclease family protein [Candidatus Moranbacteria bacterium]|nr:GIY-YIG nuclease family protein [Candidatus Moranbacteria bacterium]